MKIWLLITNLQGGGAEKVFSTFASSLQKRGHDVKLILFENRVDFELPASVSAHVLDPGKRRISKGWMGKRAATWRLRRWIGRQSGGGPDLVISTLPFADEVVHGAGLRNVWYCIPNPLSPQISALRGVSERKARRRLTRFRRLYDGQNLLAVSHGVAEELREQLGFRKSRIVTIYNPFDFDEIARRAALPERDLPKEPYIVHAGRFVPQKRHDVLLDAFAAAGLPHRLILLTGASSGLREMIAARGLDGRVTIAGFRRNPFPWFAKASALVHSSDFEGFGNVLVEALACGTPVVSTDCPAGPREILTGSLSRYLSPCGDPDALARNLIDCIASPPAIDRTSLARFSKDRALDAIEALANCGPPFRAGDQSA